MKTAKEAKEASKKREKPVFDDNCSMIKDIVIGAINDAIHWGRYWVVFETKEFDFRYLETTIPELKSLGYLVEKTDQVFRVSWE